MLEVTTMSCGDIDGILEIENQCFATPWTKSAFEMEMENKIASYVVAKEDGRVVGYGGMWWIIDEAHITNIAVHEDFRGRKIGSQVLEGMISLSKDRNIQRMTLEVRVGNEAAKNLYKKYGFVEAGIRPKYYADNNEDAIIMWLTF